MKGLDRVPFLAASCLLMLPAGSGHCSEIESSGAFVASSGDFLVDGIAMQGAQLDLAGSGRSDDESLTLEVGAIAAVRNPPYVRHSMAGVSGSHNSVFGMSYDRLVELSEAVDPDGDPVRFQVQASRGGLGPGLVATSLAVNVGSQFLWRAGSPQARLTVVPGDGLVQAAHPMILSPAGPLAMMDRASLQLDSDAVITLSRMLANDFGVLLVVGIGSPTANGGNLSLANGVLRYHPRAGFSGTDEIIYTVVGSLGLQATGSVLVEVAPGISKPLHQLQISKRDEDGSFVLEFAGVSGSAYSLEVSEDLKHWFFLGNAAERAYGIMLYEDSGAHGRTKAFYRIISGGTATSEP